MNNPKNPAFMLRQLAADITGLEPDEEAFQKLYDFYEQPISTPLQRPFCAWCGGDCQCDDWLDDEEIERRESFFCDCLSEGDYGEQELATGRCSCCGGTIQN